MISQRYRETWDQLEGSIARGIEQHRKSDITVQLLGPDRKPLPGRQVAVEQISSAFLFGANLFMVECFDTPELNRRFEEAYTGLFNAGTVALYWRDLEREPGKPRFSAHSGRIRRRPPVDLVIDFARRHGLNLAGHPLVWDFIKWSVPDWLDDAACASPAAWESRIQQIGERYGDVIDRWDVVNEAVLTPNRLANNTSRVMPTNYERMAFTFAERHIPRGHLMINETLGGSFLDGRPRYRALIDRLLADEARIDGIGMQFHYFQDEQLRQIAAGELCPPAPLVEAMDDLARYQRSIHISEITLTSPRADGAEGLADQAEVARNFYRLWFSHPAVHAITWWNVPDGAAAPGEDTVDSGLLNVNLEPKPSYTALHDLIHKQWRTRLTTQTDADGKFTFRGFHGGYRALLDGSVARFTLATRNDAVVPVAMERAG